MAYACIDVGSNTTRLLVAEPRGGRLRELMTQRAFTRIGKSLTKRGAIPAEKVAEVADVVATQARLARELGADRIAALATAAIRDAGNAADLVGAVRERAGVELQVLSDRDEARLSFVGATKTLGAPVEGPVGVVDVGGGSTEIAIGTVTDGVSWFCSLRIGSGALADRCLHSDPPAPAEIAAARERAAEAFADLDEPPRPGRAVAVGGSASSLRRLVGAELAPDTLERSIELLGSAPSAELARRFDLVPERVRLLPAGVLILDEVTRRLGLPLTVGRGGLREGAILEMAAGADLGRSAPTPT